MAAPDFGEKGYQTEEEVALSRVVERGLREARAIDTEALCVVAGEKVWSVECNIRIIDHGGNLADACNLAAVAAFHNFRRPEIRHARPLFVCLCGIVGVWDCWRVGLLV